MFKVKSEKSEDLEFELWEDGDINIRIGGIIIGYFSCADGKLHLFRISKTVREYLKRKGLTINQIGYLSIFREI